MSNEADLVSVWAGAKRTCPPSDLAEEGELAKRPPCISSKGIHNFNYPRTGLAGVTVRKLT
jgi:NAD+ diphosphatase